MRPNAYGQKYTLCASLKEELIRQIIENDKRIAALRQYAIAA